MFRKINRSIRAALRATGLPIHKGWTPTDRWGFSLKCTGCGERRSSYMLSYDYDVSWWETTESGNGDCGKIRELPIKIC